jgi:hypothetical protein
MYRYRLGSNGPDLDRPDLEMDFFAAMIHLAG